jgi:hypothetical protein
MLAASLSAASGACAERLCQPQYLAPVAQKLAQQKPIHIMMIGDSLTAGDMISNGWRGQLDSVFGSAGRGVVDGGRPYKGYITWGIDAQNSPGWSVNGIFGNFWQGDAGPAVGLSGYTKTATRAGEYMTLEAEDARYTFDRFVLCGQAGPFNGSVMVSLGHDNAIIPFFAEAPRPICREVNTSQPVASVVVRTLEDKPVQINSMGTFRRQSRGITLSNLGVPGSQFSHAGRKNDATMFAEFQAYKPDMVVVSFGTNEGFNASLDIGEYQNDLVRQVRQLQTMLPDDVPIMLMGPPNAMTRSSAIAYAGAASPVSCETGLLVPGNIRHVSSVQRYVAQQMGLVFWDWGMAMGGPCAMYSWRAAGWAAQDAIHFKKEGGLQLGAILAGDLRAALQWAGGGGRGNPPTRQDSSPLVIYP